MGEALVTLPNGSKAKITFDSKEQLDATVSDLVTHAPAPQKPSVNLQNAEGMAPNLGGAEALAHFGSSMVAAPVAGLAGIATAAGNAMGITNKQPADVVRNTQEAMTYQPRTQGGKDIVKTASIPFELIAKGADVAGGAAAEVTGSPAVGAAVNTAIQSAPALLMRGRAGAVAEEAPAAARIAEPVAKAQEYVRNSTGLDWNSLSDGVKSTLTKIAESAGGLEKLDPKALERQARLESLDVPVPATRGQITRDPVQLRNEGNVSATEAGKPIRDVYVAQNKAIIDNLDVLKGKTRGTADTPEQVGQSVQDAGLRAKLDVKRQEVKQKYADAKAAGELTAPVSPKPIIKTIAESPDKTHFGWVQSWLTDMGVVKKNASGTITRKLTLQEMEDLRQAAVARAMDGGTEAHYAGKIISAIDQATEGVGGKAYQAARKARREQATEFEEQGAVAQLVENKSRTDRAVALEDTWRKTVIGGSIDDLTKVKRSLLTGGDAATRTAGKKAWRDIRAQTIDYITKEATKSVTRFEDGTPNVTPASMERAIKSVGPEKLNEIFGPGTVKQLNRIMEATRDIKTEPPTGFKGSPTFANIIAFLEKSMSRVPLIGDTAVGAVKVAAKLRDIGETGRQVKAAQQKPLSQAEAVAKRDLIKQERIQRNRAALAKSAGYALPATDRQ